MTMEFFLSMMARKNLFLSLLLCYSLFRAADSHLVIEEKTECNLSRRSKMDLSDLPPISIVDLTRKSQKVSRKEAENKKSSKPHHTSALLAQLPLPQPAAHCPGTSRCSPPSFHLSTNSHVFIFQKNAKRKISPKPRPPPAANCVPTFKTCKPHLNSCCHYCALCKCRIFQTICQCLMLNPKC
ncbi:Agouti-signaling protein [Lonchura striata]|uniref:Agouti-signaling protein n=1 Tax=Lonchura striata TaxID=40157 RepID=A0A218UG95_9PASE|nr:Agouti-signaling protein [Lonchura striata domestica]